MRRRRRKDMDLAVSAWRARDAVPKEAASGGVRRRVMTTRTSDGRSWTVMADAAIFFTFCEIWLS